jgi:hypothetical protein
VIPVPLHVINDGADWPAWVQAVGSVLAILVTVGSGIYLQDRERKRKEADSLANQIAALTAIAERCVKLLERLNERATKGTLARDELGWLGDEALAMEATTNAIDLMSIRSTALIAQAAELQEAARTCRRRLGYAAASVKNGRQTKNDQFDDPLERARKALAAMKNMA